MAISRPLTLARKAAWDFRPPEDVRSLVVWELESGVIACRLKGHATMPRSLAFSPDSRMLLAGSQNPQDRSSDLILWDVKSCQIVRRFDTDHDVTSIAFNADGGRRSPARVTHR